MPNRTRLHILGENLRFSLQRTHRYASVPILDFHPRLHEASAVWVTSLNNNDTNSRVEFNTEET